MKGGHRHLGEPGGRRIDQHDAGSAVTRESFVTRWRGRRDELARLGAHVDGAKLCDELLADVEAMLTSEDESLLGLHEAAARSGYSRDIWNGAKYYEEAIDQLFGYLTWRESFGIVISFAKVKNFTDVLSKAKETTTKHSRYVPDTLSEIRQRILPPTTCFRRTLRNELRSITCTSTWNPTKNSPFRLEPFLTKISTEHRL